jgi:hypothetical protein
MATRIRLATSAEQPINRIGALSGYAGDEGDVVGLDPTTGNMILADADNAAPIPAIGVAATFVRDPSDWSTYPEPVQAQADEYYSRLGEHRMTAVREGVIVENIGDTALNFTPGEPVYLASGGGMTQTKPSTTDDLIQCLGVAIDDGEAVYVSVDADYTLSA